MNRSSRTILSLGIAVLCLALTACATRRAQLCARGRIIASQADADHAPTQVGLEAFLMKRLIFVVMGATFVERDEIRESWRPQYVILVRHGEVPKQWNKGSLWSVTYVEGSEIAQSLQAGSPPGSVRFDLDRASGLTKLTISGKLFDLNAGRFFYVDLRQQSPVIDQWEPRGFAGYRLETSVRNRGMTSAQAEMIERTADPSGRSLAEIRGSWASDHLWWDWKYMTDDLINHLLPLDEDVYQYVWED